MCAAVDKLLFVGGAVARDWSEERERSLFGFFANARGSCERWPLRILNFKRRGSAIVFNVIYDDDAACPCFCVSTLYFTIRLNFKAHPVTFYIHQAPDPV